MPKRDRLATTLLISGSLRDSNGCRIMEDLVALCSSQNTDTFCASLNGSRTECVTCGLSKSSGSHNWWYHLYGCRKRQTSREGRFAEFCFLCFEWLEGAEAWNDHARQHLKSMPLRYNPTVFRGNLVRPSLCPEYLGNDGLPPRQRMRQFLSVTEWKDYVGKCIGPRHDGRIKCRHPRCYKTLVFNKVSTFVEHYADIHQIPSPRSGEFGTLDSNDGPSLMSSRFHENTQKSRRVSKRRTRVRQMRDVFVNYTQPNMKRLTLQDRDGRNSRAAKQKPNKGTDS